MKCFVIAILLLFSWHANTQKLQTYKIDPSYNAVSGISSGGAMAIQMHVAHSKSFSAMGALAAPPYWCANANILTATTSCMVEPSLISITELVAATTFAYGTFSIDDPEHLYSDRVWIFGGTKDTVVDPGVVGKTYAYYQQYTNPGNLQLVQNISTEHAWITNDYGNACDYLGSPYINNCNYDTAKSMLNHFYGSLNPKGTMNSTNFIPFQQSYYTPLGIPPSTISMDSIGYVYVPTSCRQAQLCKLVVFLHGCDLEGVLDTIFIPNLGLNDWAETNNIVVLYPQVVASQLVPYNPKACWDWWGYTGLDYATQLGPQVITVMNMINALIGA